MGPVERTSTGPLHFSGVSVTAPARLWKGWVPYSAGPALLAEELARGAHSARCVFFVCPEVPYSLCLCAQSVLANQNMSTPYVLTFHRHHDGFDLQNRVAMCSCGCWENRKGSNQSSSIESDHDVLMRILGEVRGVQSPYLVFLTDIIMILTLRTQSPYVDAHVQ